MLFRSEARINVLAFQIALHIGDKPNHGEQQSAQHRRLHKDVTAQEAAIQIVDKRGYFWLLANGRRILQAAIGP